MFPTLALVALLVGKIHCQLEAPVPGYGVFIPSWTVQLSPGSEPVTINGTVEDVVSEIKKVNPHWIALEGATDSSEPSSSATRRKKRADFSGGDVECLDSSHGYGHAIKRRIQQGIRYLHGVHGRPHHEAGPEECGRVSCSYNSAIWWCNNNRDRLQLSSFQDIADGAQRVLNICPAEYRVTHGDSVAGAAYHPRNNWLVIVRKNEC
ncbi:hypothetical protein JDV02_007269 [Purpureocillium takamizusanense]|uniref:Secreted protein n=1 Tax=Purpureocillium takamizusanense TaxID=2060973 RepID=A0A9Q8QHY9_9HYPO|nr:uncharacterized protein JDV02_007269 [Purpureocillium takamizusanense]UNI21264.1 hypothetical protein JDV02_007269 [Purpureocillium takamizusanense]